MLEFGMKFTNQAAASIFRMYTGRLHRGGKGPGTHTGEQY
jgi:hypothetical protein